MDNQRTARSTPPHGDPETHSGGIAGSPGDVKSYGSDPPPSDARAFRPNRRHITQEPIFDSGAPPCDRRRAQDELGSPHRHMGVATADPQYLPSTSSTAMRDRPSEIPQAVQNAERRKVIHSDRYLQTPKAGRAIFTSREERAKRTMRRFFGVLILAAVILGLIWYFSIR